MQAESCVCGYCKGNNNNFNGLEIQDGQWLEELGDLIAAAVEEGGKVQPVTANCCGRLVPA